MPPHLIALFKSLAPFTDEELLHAGQYFNVLKLKKNDFFTKAGKYTDLIGFVDQGLLRSFYTIKDKEITTYFLQPGNVAVALLGFLQEQPAMENIQVLENSELYIIKRDDLHSLYNNSWKWQQVGRKLIEQYYVKMEQRSISLQSLSAVEKYKQFMEDFPEIYKKVQLYHIASFLGISPETLSRIRNIR